ncbi:MAG: ABC transporter permease [Ignisphaera sp.]|uniref:ABC transporter permease n=1 Tax=Ignisphaera aggregans TaxID=334771 RepID=A0A7C4NNL4_9CREN
MPRIAIVKRELHLLINIALRTCIAVAGIGIAVAILSSTLGIAIDSVLDKVVGAFTRPDILRYFVVFLPIGLGLTVAFQARLWNLGAEGQLVIGAIASTYVALFTSIGTIPVLGPISSLIFAAIAGGLWSLIPILLRIYLRVNEALLTLMMNYIAYYIVNYLVYGHWRGRYVYGYPETDLIPEPCRLPWLPGYSFSIYSLIAVMVLIPVIYFFLYRTRTGTAIRALGTSITAVELSGISSKRTAILAFVISGAIAGFIGGNEVLMYHRKLVPGEKIGAGMGFTSILVAWFADLNPLAIPLSAYYVSALHYLRMIVQVGELTEPVARFFTGIIFALLLISIFISKYKVMIRK